MTKLELSFVKNFEADVHLQYQQMGSKLRNTVRTKNNVTGSSVEFLRLNSGGMAVECVMSDFYAGDWIDRIDELKTNINEQQVVAKAGAFALGRKTDELIINQLATATKLAGAGTDGLTKAKVLDAFEILGEIDVPDDGQRFGVVGWKQWSELLNIEEFANSDYVGEDDLPWKGTQAKRWAGALWLPHSGLPKTGNVRKCFWYHKTAVGHAIGAKVKTDITWHGDRAAHFVNNMMSQGACLIDPSMVVIMPCMEP
ncbi:MAG: hypothetical protein IPK79_01105 [Vampirovibrionales bacterium]|nr:hypothetical protein [Vampirovibrionales bacterium]